MLAITFALGGILLVYAGPRLERMRTTAIPQWAS
jgi:hypothetical protein